MPGGGLGASAGATGQHAVGELPTQRARKLTFIYGEALEDLVVLERNKHPAQLITTKRRRSQKVLLIKGSD